VGFVLSGTERSSALSPFLYIHINALLLRNGVYAYSISVALTQDVLVWDTKTRTLAQTWKATGLIGTIDVARMATALREAVRDQVDQFINAYLAMNPK
jgi:hypothetical protein